MGEKVSDCHALAPRAVRSASPAGDVAADRRADIELPRFAQYGAKCGCDDRLGERSRIVNRALVNAGGVCGITLAAEGASE